jgi:hypothetical protein
MKRVLMILILSAPLAVFSIGVKQEILINNQGVSTVALTNYQIKYTVNSENTVFWSYCRNDGNDVRFEDSGSTALTYSKEYYDYANKNAIFWIKVPIIPADRYEKIYMTFGDPSKTTTTSDPDNVFEFYDGFSTGTTPDTSKWTNSNPTGITIVNGELKCTSQSGIILSQTNYSSTQNFVFESKVRVVDTTSDFCPLSLYISSVQVIGFHINDAVEDGYRKDNSWDFFDDIRAPKNTDLIYKIEIIDPDISKLYCFKYNDNATVYSATTTKAITNYQIRLPRRADDTGGGTFEAYWDWIRVRKYSAVEPAVYFGNTTYTNVALISGFIKQSNTTLSGVSVTLTNISTTSTVTVTTGINGYYEFNILSEGQYKISCSKTGVSFIQNDVVVNVTSEDITQNIDAYGAAAVETELKLSATLFTPGVPDPNYSRITFTYPNTNSEELKLNIFNAKGNMIKELSVTGNDIVWDAVDKDGRAAPGGVYFYQVKLSGNIIKKGKFVVVR